MSTSSLNMTSNESFFLKLKFKELVTFFRDFCGFIIKNFVQSGNAHTGPIVKHLSAKCPHVRQVSARCPRNVGGFLCLGDTWRTLGGQPCVGASYVVRTLGGHLADTRRTIMGGGFLGLADTWRTLGGHGDTWRTIASLLDLTRMDRKIDSNRQQDRLG